MTKVNIDPGGWFDLMSLWPIGPFGWALQVVPVAWAVWTERAGKPLARGPYTLYLVLWYVGLTLLRITLIAVIAYLIFTHDPAGDASPPDAAWVLVSDYVVGIFISIILARLLVRRMQDAGIDQRWAYLAMLPILDCLMFLAFMLQPSSPARDDPAAAPLPQR